MEWISLIVSVGISVVSAIATSFLTLGKYKEKVDQLEKREEKHLDRTNKLCEDIASLKTTVAALQRSVDKNAGIADAHSPLALTEKGQKLVEDSGFMKIFNVIKDDLVEQLEKEEPYSQYDVQEKARMMLSGMMHDPRFRQVEDWAYKNGQDLNQILRSGGIPLRDYYFEKHPEIVDPRESY